MKWLGSWPDQLCAVSGPKERVLRRTVVQIVDCAPVVLFLDVPVPHMVCGEVADVLGPCFVGTWEPLPQARVLEPAAGVRQDLARLERARRRTASEVVCACRELYSNPVRLAAFTADELRCVSISMAQFGGTGGTPPAQGGM